MERGFEQLDAFENNCEKNNFVQIAQRISLVIKGRFSMAQWVPDAEPGSGLLHHCTGVPNGLLLLQVGV